jgi:hypothetical protein
MAVSTLTLASRLNMQIAGLITALDIDLIGRETGKTLNHLKLQANDMRLDIRDWEMADNRSEMDKHARAGLKRLEEIRADILKVSERGIFSAFDVIDLSAQIDAIVEELR